LRLVLWALAQGLDVFPEAPPPGLVTVPVSPDAPDGYFEKSGYRRAGGRAIRIDMLERLADLTRAQDSRAGFEATPDMLSITGMTLEQFADLMEGLGYRAQKDEREKKKPEAVPGMDEAATPAPTVSDQTPGEDEADTSAAAPGPDMAPKSAPVAPPETETFFVFTWKPVKKQADAAKRAKPPGNKPKRDKPRQAKKSAASPVRKEKPIDPDNPFAALMALKSGK